MTIFYALNSLFCGVIAAGFFNNAYTEFQEGGDAPILSVFVGILSLGLSVFSILLSP